MQRWRTAHGAGCARSLLARTILLICIGWILNMAGEAVAAPAIGRDSLAGANDSNNKIHSQPIIHPPHIGDTNSNNSNHDDDDRHHQSDDRERVTAPTENMDINNRDKIETDNHEYDRVLPVILLPDNLLYHNSDNNSSRNVSSSTGQDIAEEDNPKIVIEYQPNLIIRCAAKGNPKPNVTWEYEGGTFPQYVVINCLTHGHGRVHSKGVDEGLEEVDSNGENEAWVDLKLPKLNNAFYGTLRCRAENKFGNSTWEVELIHNANSSMLMKVARCTLAIVFLVLAIITVKVISWMDRKRRDRLYKRLPPQDLEIINKFKKGLEPPPPSPCSSIIVPTRKQSILDGATSCIKGIELTVSGEDGGNNECGTSAGDARREGYRPVKYVSSSPDFQKRLINGGTSTPSTCSSTQVLNNVNSWTNYVPYDDKMETSSQHFDIDFSKMIESGSYGMVYVGKIRNDLTMEWSTVAVKSGKTERNDDSHLLEFTLTELKILASLPKRHENIVNLNGAYTKLLHKRQALVFVDYCENGTLEKFIDLNRANFRDIFTNSGVNDGESTASVSAKDTVLSIQNCSGPCDIESKPITFTAKSGVSINIDSDKQQEEKTVQHAISHKELLTWAWQVAEGMNYLHRNRVIHGNLCTANIYLTSSMKIKIGNIGYPPMEESMQTSSDDASTSKKLLSVPSQYCYEPFSKRSDIWEYGRVIWEIFSLRKQECPDNIRIVNFMQNGNGGDSDEEDDELDIPQYASPEIFELMLCCWNENATLCPEFDFYVKSFKKVYKEVIVATCAKDRSTEN